MDLTNVLVISGKPDLSELVSQTKTGAIVANLVTNQKFPVFKNDRISSLGEIRIFTTTDEVPLSDVMESIYNLLDAKTTDFDPKKADSATMFELLGKALPDYDTERVHASDVKKLFSWYNILLNAGKLTPSTKEENATEGAAETETKA